MARPQRASSPSLSDLSSPPASPEAPSPLMAKGSKRTTSPAKGGIKKQKTPSPPAKFSKEQGSPASAKERNKTQKAAASPAKPSKREASPKPAKTPTKEATPSPWGSRKKTPRDATPAEPSATDCAPPSGSSSPAKRTRRAATPAPPVPNVSPPPAKTMSPPAKKPRAPSKETKAVASSKVAKPALTAAQRRRKQQWSAPAVFTNTKSPLTRKNVDLRAMLCHPTAWDSLSRAQQRALLAVFPPNFIKDKGTAAARPNTLALSNSDDFRHDCARYVDNIAMGRHDPAWILEAQAAHESRAAGEFDDYLRAKFREDFEVDPPEGFPEGRHKARPNANESNADE